MLLRILFCLSSVISLLWLAVCATYINVRIGWTNLLEMPPVEMGFFLSAIIAPLILMWVMIAFLYHICVTQKQAITMEKILFYINTAISGNKNNSLIYVNDFLADLNNVIADIAIRACLLRQSAVEDLWRRVHEGDRWAFCNVILGNAEDIRDFDFIMAKHAIKNDKLALSINVFCEKVHYLFDFLHKNNEIKHYTSLLESSSLGVLYNRMHKINSMKSDAVVTISDDDLNVTEIPIKEAKKEKEKEKEKPNPYTNSKSNNSQDNAPELSNSVMLEMLETDSDFAKDRNYNWEEKKKEILAHYGKTEED